MLKANPVRHLLALTALTSQMFGRTDLHNFTGAELLNSALWTIWMVLLPTSLRGQRLKLVTM